MSWCNVYEDSGSLPYVIPCEAIAAGKYCYLIGSKWRQPPTASGVTEHFSGGYFQNNVIIFR